MFLRRGATSIEECRPCGKKTLGVVSLGKGLVGGAADAATRIFRMTICEKCFAEDSTGARLYRVVDGTVYCGRPRLQKLLRDEATDGCGCVLSFKTGRAQAACPLGRWGAVSKFG
jgi:ribosomal protein L40E